jgi:hypothetical protein
MGGCAFNAVICVTGNIILRHHGNEEGPGPAARVIGVSH